MPDPAYKTVREPIVRATLASTHALTGAGLADVIAARVAQIDRHGFTLAHDLEHHPGEFGLAVLSYAATAVDQLHGRDHPPAEVPDTWPWEPDWWKPADPRANIVTAAALMLALLDRLDHAPRDSGDDLPLAEGDHPVTDYSAADLEVMRAVDTLGDPYAAKKESNPVTFDAIVRRLVNLGALVTRQIEHEGETFNTLALTARGVAAIR